MKLAQKPGVYRMHNHWTLQPEKDMKRTAGPRKFGLGLGVMKRTKTAAAAATGPNSVFGENSEDVPREGLPNPAESDDTRQDIPSNAGSKPEPSADRAGVLNEYEKRSGETGDDEDPLDAFMQGIEKQATYDAENIGKERVDKVEQLDTEDHIDDYIEAMRRKGIRVGETNDTSDPQWYNNSDDEVYGMAELLNREETEVRKKDIDPLPPIDHSSI
ncbi:hypothetical protein EV182_007167, partial [Spiromyces aspiralis]